MSPLRLKPPPLGRQTGQLPPAIRHVRAPNASSCGGSLFPVRRTPTTFAKLGGLRPMLGLLALPPIYYVHSLRGVRTCPLRARRFRPIHRRHSLSRNG